MTDSFAGYISVGRQSYTVFSTWEALLQALLTFPMSIEKSAIILLSFSLDVTYFVFLAAFNIFYVYLTF